MASSARSSEVKLVPLPITIPSKIVPLTVFWSDSPSRSILIFILESKRLILGLKGVSIVQIRSEIMLVMLGGGSFCVLITSSSLSLSMIILSPTFSSLVKTVFLPLMIVRPLEIVPLLLGGVKKAVLGGKSLSKG